MPTYEYECLKCGHRFEKFQGINDPPVKTCPKCRGKVKRLIGTGAGLLFKGGGFYITDYRSSGYKEKQKAESGGGDSGGGDSGTKSDSKPKSDAKPAKEKKEKKSRGGDS